jgi:hypothetical protein
MEEMNLIDDTSFEGGFNAEIKTYLMETAKWAKFISIVSIVIGGLMAVFSLFASTLLNTAGNMGLMPFGPGVIIAIYLVAAALIIIPNIFLLNFATKAISSLRSGSETELTVAFRNLKTYYKFIGILTAIVLGFYALIIVFAVIGGAAAGF